jgi:hypothetical protein
MPTEFGLVMAIAVGMSLCSNAATRDERALKELNVSNLKDPIE